MHAVLEIITGSQQGKKVEVPSGQTLTVGRHAQATLAISEDAMMSNVHFALECDGQNWRVRDLKSRFGTHVNQARVAEAVVVNGDRIMAGNTTFLVQIVVEQRLPDGAGLSEKGRPAQATASQEPATERPAPRPAGDWAPIQNRVLHTLRSQPEPLYALLDAARDPVILAWLMHAAEECQTLYEGPQGEAMAAFGPFLIHLPAESALLETLVREGWGKSWGVYLTSESPFKEVRQHFRRFLKVRLPDGKEAYFRYYDPRVLRAFLPTLNPTEAASFFGSVKGFLMESERPGKLLHFLRNLQGSGVKTLTLPLVESASPMPGGRASRRR